MRGLWIAALLLAAFAERAPAGDEPAREDPAAVLADRLATAPVEDVLRAMMSGDPLWRRVAALVAGRRAGEAGALVDELVAATGDEDARVRLAATRALGTAGERSDAVARLERLAERASDAAQRRAAAAALVRISPDIDASRRLLLDPSGRELAFAGLTDLGAEGVPPLAALAHAEDWRTRAALAALLRDASGAVRVAALETLPQVQGGGLLTVDDVRRTFSSGCSPRERLLLLSALVDEGLPGGATDFAVREAALAAAAVSGSAAERLFAVRMAHATGCATDAALVSLARLAASEDPQVGVEAASTLYHAAKQHAFPRGAVDALRPLTAAEVPGPVAATVALTLARAGLDGPRLAGPATRLLVTGAWPDWACEPVRRPPTLPTEARRAWRRNLRAGGPRVRSLPRVPGPIPDDVLVLLTEYPDDAVQPLAALLAHASVATRASAAWTLGEVRGDDAVAADLLHPLLDDPALAVRVVCACRLAGNPEHADAAVSSAVHMLLADEESRVEDPVIRDVDESLDDGGALQWVDELVATLARDPRAAVDALVAARERATETQTVFSFDVTTGEAEEHETLGWARMAGERHLAAMLAAVGEPAPRLLSDAVRAGGTLHRRAALWLLARAADLPEAVRADLRELRDDPDVGPDVRTILDR